MLLLLVSLFASVGTFGSAATALAQEERVPPPPEAVALYQEGRELYQQGRYRDALLALQRAAALDPTSANLAYNVARVQELLGDIDPAIASYQRYVDLLPATNTEERARVEGIMRRLEGARTELGAVRQPASEPENGEQLRDVGPIITHERGVIDKWFFISAGAAVASLAIGTVFGIRALGLQGDAREFVLGRDGSLADHDALVSSADSSALIADVAFIAGSAFAVTSLLLYVLRTREVEHYPEGSNLPVAGVSFDAHGFMFSLRGNL